MKLDRKKYTVIAVLLVGILLLLAGTAAAQPVITSFSPEPMTAEVGDQVTWTANSPTGVSYAFYIFKRGPEGAADERVHMQWYTSSNSVTYRIRDKGTYYARVFVKDSAGNLTWTDTLGHWDIVVTEGDSLDLSDVNFVTFPDPDEEHKVGDSLNYEVAPVGGEGPFEYAFYVFKDGTRVDLRWYTGDATFSYAPTEPSGGGESDGYQVQAFIKDATGKIVLKKSNLVKVTGTSTELRIDSLQGVETGGVITWTVTAAGGTGPYQYAFYVFKDSTRVDMQWYGAASTFTYKPKDAGLYKAQAFVKDGTGKIVNYTQEDTINIDEGSAALGASVANPDPLGEVGFEKTWTATASGGEAPYEYAFYVYEGGIRVHTQWYSSKASIDYTPTKPDPVEYQVRVFVKDKTGAIVLADSVAVKFTGDTVDPFGITAVTLTSHSLVDFTAPWVWEVAIPDKHDGQGPISYCYYVYKDGTRIAMEWYKEGAKTFSYTPNEVGSYHVKAFAMDKKSKIVQKESKAQETKLYHYYFTFSSEGNDNFNDHGYVMASGFPVLKYGNLQDNLAHRGYSNHTSRSTVQVTLGADTTVSLNDPTAHQLKWIKENARIQYNSDTKKVGTKTELAKDKYYKVVDFKNSEGVCSFKLLEDDGVTPVVFTADDTKTYEFRYVSNNQDRVSYNAQNGVLTLGTMTVGAVGSGPYTWTCATGKEIRFAGLRPSIPDDPPGYAKNTGKARVEFWQYMIAPNLPYAEVKFRNIQSSEAGQEARFNFDWLINKPTAADATGYDPYEQRIGLGVSAAGKLYVMDSKGGKYTADDAHYFDWYELEQSAVLNPEWNTARLQVLADGSVQMILNGSVVYTSAPGYYNVADARRGAITLEVLQVAPAGTESEDVGNASVELKDYSFGITRLVETGPSYKK